MASYNQWMNKRLFAKTGQLSADDIAQNRGAYFGSILGTLNHSYVADLLWLRRFSSSDTPTLLPLDDMPSPTDLHQILYDDLKLLSSKRRELDALILSFTNSLGDACLTHPVYYKNMDGETMQFPLGLLLQHFFNHQTHHRGQVTTLLFQAGVDPEATDLLVMMMDKS